MFRILVIFLLLLSSAKAQKQDTSINYLVQKIVLALKNESYAELKEMIITPAVFLKEMVPREKKDDSIHHRRISTNLDYYDPDHFYRKNRSDSLNRMVFSTTIRDGKKIGILNWKDIQFVKIIPERWSNDHFVGHILFEYNGIKYAIYSVMALRLSKGYYLGTFMGVLTDTWSK